jgi:hypothetical protein
MSSVYGRQLIVSAEIDAPGDVVQAASHSKRKGGIYIHREMTWNTRSGVLMIATARELQRPIVNGYLGLSPPWFGYATAVLHRFPDPEAVWLLRKWNVDTVVGLPGSVADQPPESFEKVFEDRGLIVWDLKPQVADFHPSEGASLPSVNPVRIAGTWSRRPDHPSVITLRAPEGFRVAALEVHFGQSAVGAIPGSINVFDSSLSVKLNQGRAGEWIESLAADALLRRMSPIATIGLIATEAEEFLVELPESANSSIEQVVLLGDWAG